jgi:predicted anti-sigma-YlaC factor YlaD
VDLYHVDFATITAIWMAGSILLIFALALGCGFRRAAGPDENHDAVSAERIT